ncbi:MAG: hypothetical protein LW690_02950 [Opitutaceae bacterium]|jgi:hypothetical protein|nr:hypothetical protein [Opitutaceae bacterium]
MKLRITLLCSLLFATVLVAQTPAQLQEERIQASYLIAFGRKARTDEVGYWSKQKVADVAALVRLHKNYLQADKGTREASIRRSYIDSFGRNPDAGELKHWSVGVDTYSELMANHTNWLKANPAEQDGTIDRSYQSALGRKPSAAERAYWRSQGALNFVTLVACHEQWKKAGSQKTSGSAGFAPSSSLLATVNVSRPVANEVVAASSSIRLLEGQLIAAGGLNLIAAGGQNLIAAGGQNLIAAGGQNLIAAGGQNLIGVDGGSLKR